MMFVFYLTFSIIIYSNKICIYTILILDGGSTEPLVVESFGGDQCLAVDVFRLVDIDS